MNISTDVPVIPPTAASPRRRGAQPGNRNAVSHGYYSKKRAEAFRRVFSDSGYAGYDLDIVLALWQTALLGGGLPGPAGLRDGSFNHLCALVRRKYGLPRRGHDDELAAYFLRLCFDLAFTPSLRSRLAAALRPGPSPAMKAES
ncbi:hypothetical protein [Dehalogenimonas alkenigignens]|uniref:hypothetical protein n=1 Tax=Dehalogenimonas alkenigignens TaxID=1217799 RepID=UPI000D56EE35|nr:hypothetical protein [Dehalogenimonas alkenigignens]PVV84020.1 hypothetical protein DD509_04945 [Dehalogenimonas alkenigignens]